MGRGSSRSGEKFWIVPEQVAADRAGVDFVEWWKVVMEGPLHRAGRIPIDLSLATAEMLMSLAAARTEREPVWRLRCFRVARQHATRCAGLLHTPQALELASAEELDQGHELLRRVLALLERLIRPPPGGGRILRGRARHRAPRPSRISLVCRSCPDTFRRHLAQQIAP